MSNNYRVSEPDYFFYFYIVFATRKKVAQISCGWRHTVAVTEQQNVFSWGRGTNGQLGHGESIDRYLYHIQGYETYSAIFFLVFNC